MSNEAPHQFDFTKMPLTPAQEAVVLLSKISEQLAGLRDDLAAARAPTPPEGMKAAADRKVQIDALQARVPVAKRK